MFDFHRTVIYVIDAIADMCDVNWQNGVLFDLRIQHVMGQSARNRLYYYGQRLVAVRLCVYRVGFYWMYFDVQGYIEYGYLFTKEDP